MSTRTERAVRRLMPMLALVMGVVIAGALSISPAIAQETGRVTGTVTAQGSQQPLSGVQISVVGTRVGSLTDDNGEFVIREVPVGTQTLQARMIGYGNASQQVDVVAGQTVNVDMVISRQAIEMDQIVVTGQAGATSKRKLGNTVGSVDAADMVENAPITSVDQLFQGKTTGVNMSLSSGDVGTASTIRVRGTNSIALASEPIVYIDGVRVASNSDQSEGIWFGGQDLSRLSDLDPNNIERIEVVKGAAAATLYGTQGSSGVIQIFTKRGSTGSPQWNFRIDQGFERVPTDTFPGRLFPQFEGPNGFQAHDPKETVQNGHNHRYYASVRGGSADVRYFISANYDSRTGSIAPDVNWRDKFNTRANVDTDISETLGLNVRSGFVWSNLRVPSNNNALHGTYSQYASAVPYTATEDRVYGERFGSFTWNQELENRQKVFRNTTGITLEHLASDAFSQNLTVGIDWFTEESTKYFPYRYPGSGHRDGDKTNHDRDFADITVDYRTTLSLELGDNFSAETSAGLQGNFTNTTRVEAEGNDFPAPGVTTVSAASVTSGTETKVEEINAGVFAQETFGWQDKLFLTGGIRIDGNSAFGNEFNTQAYPKASLAYNISDESFWPSDFWSSMKIRFAYGTSGVAPAQFAADRTFSPISALQGEPGVTPGNRGDPTLGPERSVEYEAGFDAGLLEDRVGVTFTAFHQTTKDALVAKQFPPTEGFLGTQLTNIGEIRNKGVELGVNGVLIENQDVSLSTSFDLTAQENEVVDLGGIAPFSGGISTRIAEGFPVLGIWSYEIESWDAESRTHTATDTMLFQGQADPKWYGSLTTNLGVGPFNLRTMADYAGGHVKTDFSRWWGTRVRTGDDYLSLVEKPRGTPTAASDSLMDYVLTGGSGIYTDPADRITLREITLRYNVPASLLSALPLGLGRTTISISGRNLETWTSYGGISVQTTYDGADPTNRGNDFDTPPPPRVFMLTLQTALQ